MHLTNWHKHATIVLNELHKTLLTILCSLIEDRDSEFLSVTGPSLHSIHARYSAAISWYTNVPSESGPKRNGSLKFQ